MTEAKTIKSEVFLGDCMDFMRKAKDKQWDLGIVDPPYGIGDFTRSTSRGKKVERNYKRADWNDSIPTAEYFEELRRVSKEQIIWGANYYNCFSSGGAVIWGKGNRHPDMSSCEIASVSSIRTVDLIELFYAGFTEERIHPCQKPVDLYRRLLTDYAKEGFRILDTHMGSQSSRIAAYDMGFDYTGFELDPDYFAAGCKRFEQHKAQLKMF